MADRIAFTLSKGRGNYILEVGAERYKLLPLSVQKFNLFFVEDFSLSELQEVLRFDEIERCKNQSFRYLSNRAHFESELSAKLKNKGYEADIIGEVMSFLRREKLLGDEELAVNYAKSLLQTKGKQRVIFELCRKGIASEEAKKIVEGIDHDEDSTCYKALIKRVSREGELESLDGKKEYRLVNFLNSRGFSTPAIIKAMQKLKGSFNNN